MPDQQVTGILQRVSQLNCNQRASARRGYLCAQIRRRRLGGQTLRVTSLKDADRRPCWGWMFRQLAYPQFLHETAEVLSLNETGHTGIIRRRGQASDRTIGDSVVRAA